MRNGRHSVRKGDLVGREVRKGFHCARKRCSNIVDSERGNNCGSDFISCETPEVLSDELLEPLELCSQNICKRISEIRQLCLVVAELLGFELDVAQVLLDPRESLEPWVDDPLNDPLNVFQRWLRVNKLLQGL